MAGGLVVLFNVSSDTWGVMLQVAWHNGFCAVDHEEWGEPGRSVDGGTDSPEDRGEFLDPTARSSLEGHLEAWLEAVEDALIGTLGLAIRLRMSD